MAVGSQLFMDDWIINSLSKLKAFMMHQLFGGTRGATEV